MRIAVLGSGQVGGTLGQRWSASGHAVVFGVREPEKGATAVRGAGEETASTTALVVTSILDAVRGQPGQAPDVVLLATPWAAVASLVPEIAPHLQDTVLIDATNPLRAGFRVVPGPNGESGAEQVQALAPRARVVKAFNTTGFANMHDPVYDGVPSVMFHAGDDAAAKAIVAELSANLGFDAVDAGPLERARELEHLAALWISLAYGGGGVAGLGRDIAFRLMRR
jgi:NADPH-dependent F420 reductase